jgi:tRNA1(Val) A37 N6-methylase TrmN6
MQSKGFTIDAFHNGAFHAVQPVGTGHRAGSDALLLAAALPSNSKGLLADLGSGAGVAALAALVMNPQLEAVLAEADPLMADYARRTLELSQNQWLEGRATVIEADVTLKGRAREASGLATGAFAHVIANPPYYTPSERASPDSRRALAHQMQEGGLEAWLRTAAAILKPGGQLHLVWRPQQLAELISACHGRFGGLSILPLHSRTNEPAGRIILRATKGSRAPLSISPGIVLHGDDNKTTAFADAVLNGRLRLSFGPN